MHDFPMSNHVGVRIYSGTRPHIWKIADLQKGLILVHDGTETVGEGTGFGLPVLVYSNETYFSATSKVHVSQHENRCIICKEYLMDRIARNRFRNVKLENRTARAFFAYLASLYQRHAHFRFLTLKNLIGKMHVDTAFAKAEPMGKVTVTYTITKPHIWVKTDFRDLNKKRLERVFMLNEQGSKYFRKYADSQGMELVDGKIGAWDAISAEWACLKVLDGKFGFRLWRAEDGALRRGREFLKGSLDWVGLDYEVNPQNDVFEYEIEILGV
jgi:hypothetical protein